MFYRPADGWVGDLIPYYDGNEFRLFYLKTRREGEHFSDVAWNMVSTKDFIHFHDDLPTGIDGGTGSVILADGMYHMFYCDNSRLEKQLICHAISPDLFTWNKIPEDTFEADNSIYELPNWRDPHVFWNEEKEEYWMLIATRTKSGTNRSGCTGLCISKDLKKWEFKQPFYAPRIDVGTHECPDVFRIGDWWYLIYSSYTGFYATIYRMSKSLNGPWLIPEKEALDTRAFYAGKTAQRDGRTFLFGWNPTREAAFHPDWNPANFEGHDYNQYDWAGNLIVHELLQNPDGTLSVALPQEIDEYFNKARDLEISELMGAWEIAGTQAKNTESDYSLLALTPLPKICKISFSVEFDPSMRRCGVALHLDPAADRAYYLTLDKQFNRLTFNSYLMETEFGWRVTPYMTELERPMQVIDGKKYDITLILDNSICEVYVNQEIAMSTRIYDLASSMWGLFSIGENTRFTNISLKEPSSLI